MNLPNDVYIRYCSYANAEEMKKDVVRLNPARFEIGPVYSARVSRRLHGHFAWLELLAHVLHPTAQGQEGTHEDGL